MGGLNRIRYQRLRSRGMSNRNRERTEMFGEWSWVRERDLWNLPWWVWECYVRGHGALAPNLPTPSVRIAHRWWRHRRLRRRCCRRERKTLWRRRLGFWGIQAQSWALLLRLWLCGGSKAAATERRKKKKKRYKKSPSLETLQRVGALQTCSMLSIFFVFFFFLFRN